MNWIYFGKTSSTIKVERFVINFLLHGGLTYGHPEIREIKDISCFYFFQSRKAYVIRLQHSRMTIYNSYILGILISSFDLFVYIPLYSFVIQVSDGFDSNFFWFLSSFWCHAMPISKILSFSYSVSFQQHHRQKTTTTSQRTTIKTICKTH